MAEVGDIRPEGIWTCLVSCSGRGAELAQAFSITRSTTKATSRTCRFGGLGGNMWERQGSGQP